jgi:predicted dehydrogenase/nucleoside-diphosphate-sugar epimerase
MRRDDTPGAGVMATPGAAVQRDALNVLIVGAGPMAQHHARAVQRSRVAARVAAVVDPDERARERFAAAVPGVSGYADLESALGELPIDVVHVCSPPATHAAVAEQALAGGCHVYVEKPFAPSCQAAERILALAAEWDLKVCAGHQLLYEAPSREALRLLPALGAVVHVESYFSFRTVRRRAGGGLSTANEQLIDILPHPVYVLLAFLSAAAPGAPIELAGLQLGPGGTVHASVRAGALIGTLIVTLDGRPIESGLRVVGTNGTVQTDFVRGTVQSLIGPGISGIDKLLQPFRVAGQLGVGTSLALGRRLLARQATYPGLGEIVEAFYRAIAEDGPSPISAQNILGTVQICEAVARAIDQLEPPKAAARAVETGAARPLVLLTGGTGFLGKRTAAAFLARDARVRVLSRRAPPVWERLPDVEYVQADLGAPLDERILKGVAWVVHAAAETAGSWSDHTRNSVEATEHVIRAAAQAGVAGVIHVSSVAVLDVTSGRPLSEDSPLEADPRARGAYVWGKHASEQRARELGKELGIAVKIVRPGALIDAAAFEPPGRLGKRVGNVFVAVGSGADQLGVADVQLCSDAITWIVGHFAEAPELLHVVDPDLPTKRDLIASLRARNPGVRVVWLPWPVLTALSWAASGAQRLLRPGAPPVDLARVFAVQTFDTRRMRDVQRALKS